MFEYVACRRIREPASAKIEIFKYNNNKNYSQFVIAL